MEKTTNQVDTCQQCIDEIDLTLLTNDDRHYYFCEKDANTNKYDCFFKIGTTDKSTTGTPYDGDFLGFEVLDTTIITDLNGDGSVTIEDCINNSAFENYGCAHVCELLGKTSGMNLPAQIEPPSKVDEYDAVCFTDNDDATNVPICGCMRKVQPICTRTSIAFNVAAEDVNLPSTLFDVNSDCKEYLKPVFEDYDMMNSAMW